MRVLCTRPRSENEPEHINDIADQILTTEPIKQQYRLVKINPPLYLGNKFFTLVSPHFPIPVPKTQSPLILTTVLSLDQSLA
ncbi:hypothetical protein FIS3754_09630 [Fischerella sp. NIES-3754]|nr:hypothetical protein FIS3754_09630 [Fischerella sp. NIES-3754]BCX07324.1 MAG: hypothetical protein KatS3mg066_1183 [Fischerella sp.]